MDSEIKSPLNGMLTTPEAAAYLKYKAKTLRHYAWQGKIPYRRVGGRFFFCPKELDQWLERNMEVSKPNQ